MRFLLIFLLLLGFVPVFGQMPGGVPVERSMVTQEVGGKTYYVHVVQRGQTVYSISRAYGVKDFDAVVKKDIHFLSIGDTVWIPVQKANQAAFSSGSGKVSQPASAHTAQVAVTPVTIRDRIDPTTVVVSLLMPLYLGQINEISTTKFDVEQRGRKSYRQFEYIQFYEGVQMGLEKLQQRGLNVRLNVVDVPGNDSRSVEQAWRSHGVGQSDVVLAMLQKEAFARASELAREEQVFLVNPLSGRGEIVTGNPYVVKCQPSVKARVESLLSYMRGAKPDAHLFVIHSKSTAERAVVDEVKSLLEHQRDIDFTLFDWASSGKLPSAIKGKKEVVFLCLYDAGRDRNRTFVSSLLSRLSPLASKNKLSLVSLDNWCDMYRDVDIAYLQNLNYHTFISSEWDYSNHAQVDFLRQFYRQYRVEPTNYYAAMGHDAILYFVSGLNDRGSSFWRDPNMLHVGEMLRPQSLHRSADGNGFEGNNAQLYRLSNYRFVEVK